jgi:hypothetical protein
MRQYRLPSWVNCSIGFEDNVMNQDQALVDEDRVTAIDAQIRSLELEREALLADMEPHDGEGMGLANLYHPTPGNRAGAVARENPKSNIGGQNER